MFRKSDTRNRTTSKTDCAVSRLRYALESPPLLGVHHLRWPDYYSESEGETSQLLSQADKAGNVEDMKFQNESA